MALAQLLELKKSNKILPFAVTIQRQFPNDLWANYYLAYLNRDNYKEAIRYYQAALAVRPNTANFYFSMGGVTEQDKSRPRDESIPYYREAVRLAPTHATYRASFAKNLLVLGPEYESEAAEQIKQGLALEKQTDESRTFLQYDLRILRVKQGRWEEAQKAWQIVVHFARRKCPHAEIAARGGCRTRILVWLRGAMLVSRSGGRIPTQP